MTKKEILKEIKKQVDNAMENCYQVDDVEEALLNILSLCEIELFKK